MYVVSYSSLTQLRQISGTIRAFSRFDGFLDIYGTVYSVHSSEGQLIITCTIVIIARVIIAMDSLSSMAIINVREIYAIHWRRILTKTKVIPGLL